MFVQRIKEIHVEPTTVCQAECDMCARTILGYHTDKTQNHELTLEQFKTQTKDIIAGLEKIMFCGILGDPAASTDLLGMIKWAQKQNPNVVIGINSNGALRNEQWWTELGELTSKNIYSYVVFSIDGLEDTNHIYRRNVQWNKLMDNVRSYITAGGVAQWDMLVFEHNKHQVEVAKQTAEYMGFRLFRSKVSSRFAHIPESKMQPPNLIEPDIEPDEFSCMAQDTSSVYLSAAGVWYPCCFTHDEELRELDNSWGDAVTSIHNRHDSWNELTKTITQVPLPVCTKSCGTTLRKGQWKSEVFFS